jgi:tRNA threonylcarbamoyladenosine biosynthesis protein TsaB
LDDESLSDAALAVRVTWSSDDTRSLSRELVARIAQVLENAGWKMDEVDALAVGLGPGSWTSLRVVLATAKTLAQARGWKLCGVPTFDAVARAAHYGRRHDASSTRLPVETTETVEEQAPQEFRDGLVVVASRSRVDEIYSKIWRVQNNNWSLLQSESVQTPAALVAGTRLGEAILVAGEARDEVALSLQEASRQNLIWTVGVSAEETAIGIGRLAVARLASGEGDDPLSLQPLYVAPSAAERNLKR